MENQVCFPQWSEFWDKLLGPDLLIDMVLPQEWVFNIGNQCVEKA